MSAITVTSTATPLVLASLPVNPTAAQSAAVIHQHGASAPGMVVFQNGSTAVYLGTGPDVTASNGILVAADEPFTVALPAGRELYGITSSGTSAARVVVF